MLTEKKYHETLTLRFARGSVRLDTDTGTLVVRNDEKAEERRVVLGGTNYNEKFLALTQNFIDAVRGEAQPYVTHTEMWRNTRFALNCDTFE